MRSWDMNFGMESCRLEESQGFTCPSLDYKRHGCDEDTNDDADDNADDNADDDDYPQLCDWYLCMLAIRRFSSSSVDVLGVVCIGYTPLEACLQLYSMIFTA